MADGKAGAPKGNKNAVGYGRPPNPGYTNEDLVVLGEELLQWLRVCDEPSLTSTGDLKPQVVHLSEWYSQIKGMTRTQWNSLSSRECFRDYYDRAREWMGVKLLRNKDVPQTYGGRFIGIYFKEVKEEDREIAHDKIDYEVKRKAELELARVLPPNDGHIDKELLYAKRSAQLDRREEELNARAIELFPQAK